jgi:hypothetical protein
MDQRDVTKQQPIGYWLKHADKVITEHVDRVLSDNGFTRSRWQGLNINCPKRQPLEGPLLRHAG